MYQIERCERTAYVSGLHPSVRDIELFELFNRVTHVEKVILRNSAPRHALIVFRTVDGLYKALVTFHNFELKGRNLHIRPLRESSHASNDTFSALYDPFNRQMNFANSPRNRAFSNVEPRFNRGSNRNAGHRRSTNRDRNYPNGQQQNYFPQNYWMPPMNFNPDHISFDDYSGAAQEFDLLAHLFHFGNLRQSASAENAIRLQNLMSPMVSRSDDYVHRPRNSARERQGSLSYMKSSPPTWKMELQHKADDSKPEEHQVSEAENTAKNNEKAAPQTVNQARNGESSISRRRNPPPNLSLVNNADFFEKYPCTSTPMDRNAPHAHAPISPMDPAVVAYRRGDHLKKFGGNETLSPIMPHPVTRKEPHLDSSRREMTNEELSEMIVSTKNLQLNGNVPKTNMEAHLNFDDTGPAPWSPVKRLRAESGCMGGNAFSSSPQCSPIRSNAPLFTSYAETDDDVFVDSGVDPHLGTTGNHSAAQNSQRRALSAASFLPNNFPPHLAEICLSKRMNHFDDVTNNRLPSNVHSATPMPRSRQTFRFSNPLNSSRHASVPDAQSLYDLRPIDENIFQNPNVGV
ncbi:unnamed protein product [Caenorhabditis auriculariae]|uniref:RRM domain-containing protein n=1 Tax=Caenorhabditis auriculariae TaxID=2777116 RepID=A0A8S1H870_9PELO|nr:unnamed protein product [Caenorhabditis auriculariae]